MPWCAQHVDHRGPQWDYDGWDCDGWDYDGRDYDGWDYDGWDYRAGKLQYRWYAR